METTKHLYDIFGVTGVMNGKYNCLLERALIHFKVENKWVGGYRSMGGRWDEYGICITGSFLFIKLLKYKTL